jgi:hypothetical protein
MAGRATTAFNFVLQVKHREIKMAAIAGVLSRAFGTKADVETLKTIVTFCGLGLAVSLLLAANSVDTSARFF